MPTNNASQPKEQQPEEPASDPLSKLTYIQALLFSVLNASVMLALAISWLSLPRTFGDEAFFIKWTSLIKKSLIGIDKKPDPSTVLYVDISKSKVLLEAEDPLYEEVTGYHKTIITDREQLANFLQYLGTYGEDIPIVIFDITFEDPSPADSLLQAAIDHFPFPLIGAQKLFDDGHLGTSVIQLPTGVASYLSSDNQFMKYPLFVQDSLPTLPLMILHLANQYTYDRQWQWPRINQHPSLINPIIDFKIRPIDLNDGSRAQENTFPIRALGTLLFESDFWEAADIRTLLKGKTIIVGDFKDDMHQTVFGDLPGPLIVHNAYLTLQEGESLIQWSWLLMLFSLFFWMSWRVYIEEKKRERSQWWKNSKTTLGRIIADSIDDTFFLVIGTILSYILFNIHINILILLIYLKIMTYLLKRFIFKAT